MHNVSNNLSPPHMKHIFEVRTGHLYNLKINSQFFRSLVKSARHGAESLSCLGPNAWVEIYTKTFSKI